MPYVDECFRSELDPEIDKLLVTMRQLQPMRAGLLNYVISRLVAGVCSPSAGWKYAELNEAIGVLECAKQELYGRVGRPKEDLAIEDNGDIHEYRQWMMRRFPGDFR